MVVLPVRANQSELTLKVESTWLAYASERKKWRNSMSDRCEMPSVRSSLVGNWDWIYTVKAMKITELRFPLGKDFEPMGANLGPDWSCLQSIRSPYTRNRAQLFSNLTNTLSTFLLLSLTQLKGGFKSSRTSESTWPTTVDSHFHSQAFPMIMDCVYSNHLKN